MLSVIRIFNIFFVDKIVCDNVVV